MGILNQPLRFEPYFRPMVWGGRNLAHYLGKNLPTADPYGESWEVSDHRLHPSKLATASLFGVTLRQLMEQHRHDLLGPAADRHSVFPWLIKLLDAQDWLSVQVHPDEAAAARLCPGEGPKTEAWLVLSAAPTSRIYAGLKPGVGPAELRQALQDGTVADRLHSFTPRVGDFIHLPAGTVHALGGGVVIAEIQQTSDATFRLFDWNRKDPQGRSRPLHIEEGLACIDWSQGPIAPRRMGPHAVRLVTCPYYEVSCCQAESDLGCDSEGSLAALIVLEGRGRFSNGEYVLPGDVWLLPATMKATRLHLDARLSGLWCTLPRGGA